MTSSGKARPQRAPRGRGLRWAGRSARAPHAAAPQHRQQRRLQAEGGDDRDERDDESGEPERADKGDRDDEQDREADRDHDAR